MNSNINKDRKCVLTIYFEKEDTLRCHFSYKVYGTYENLRFKIYSEMGI